jgi:hypothetical protein
MTIFDKVFREKLQKIIQINNQYEKENQNKKDIHLELEVAFGNFDSKGFTSSISFEKFKLLLSKHEKYKMQYKEYTDTIYQDNYRVTDENIIIIKEKIEQLDNKDWDIRFRLSSETNLNEKIKLENPILVRKKQRYSFELISNEELKVILDLTEVRTQNSDLSSTYECEIEFISKKLDIVLIENVITTFLKTYNQTFYPLSNSQKQFLLKNYFDLTKTEKFLGTQAVSLHIENKNKVLSNYAITDKADGIRKNLYIDNQKSVYFLNSKMEFTKIMTLGTEIYNNTIIDGEFINNSFYAFDILYFKGKKLLDDKNFKLKERLNFIFEIEPFLNKNFKTTFFYIKNYFFVEGNEIYKTIKQIMENSKYEIDGIIFTPTEEPYPSKKTWFNLYKWKIPELNSIDLKIEKKEKGLWFATVFNGKQYIPFSPAISGYTELYKVSVSEEIDKLYPDQSIVEFIIKNKKLVPIRLRSDKLFSNYIDIALDVLDTVINPVNFLEEEKEKKYSFEKMRKFHNKIKKDLVEYVVKKSDNKDNFKLGSFCCGKGGDILKWKNSNIKSVYGIDINENFLKEAYIRKENIAPENDYSFMELDLSKKSVLFPEKVDAIEAQFCIHYFLKNKKEFFNFIINVVSNLKENGYFYGTFLNGKKIHNSFPKQTKKEFSITKEYPYTKNYDKLDTYGNKIIVELPAETITISEEYLVKFEEIVKILKEQFSLELVSNKSFEELYKDKYELSDYEKEYSFLSETFVFVKKENIDIKEISIKEAINIETGTNLEWKKIRNKEFYIYKKETAFDVLKRLNLIPEKLEEDNLLNYINYILFDKNMNKIDERIENTDIPYVILMKEKEKVYLLTTKDKVIYFNAKLLV